jgi:hypothetical protein
MGLADRDYMRRDEKREDDRPHVIRPTLASVLWPWVQLLFWLLCIVAVYYVFGIFIGVLATILALIWRFRPL